MPLASSQTEAQQEESSADERTAMASGGDGGAGGPSGYDGTSSASRQRRGRSGTGRQQQQNRGERRWWRRLAEKYGSIDLDNKGSVARDHLALERTFLAWLRTSLAFASIGVAITQLFRLNTAIAPREPGSLPGSGDGAAELRHIGKPLGATFLAVAIVVLFVGFHRYFESQHWIIRGKFPASRGSVFAVTLIAGVLIVASLVIVVALNPGRVQR